MEKENIHFMLEVLCQYNTVRITHVFAKEHTGWVCARCLPNTAIIELTFLETNAVAYYEVVHDATDAVIYALNPPSTF